ncbi:MAG: PrgI family mobile element protein [Stackebrandtia sp.]
MIDDQAPATVAVPADVDIADKILFGLTAKQVAIVAPVAIGLIAAWQGLLGLLPMWMLAAATAVIGVATATIALGRRDGADIDSLLVAAVKHPRRILAPGRPQPAPAWATTSTPAPVVSHMDVGVGVISTNGVATVAGGAAVAVEVSTVTFELCSGYEQTSWIGGLARALHAMTGKVQILVTTTPVNLRRHINRLRDAATDLAHPRLELAARAHAEFLDELAGRRDVWRRRVIVAAAVGNGGDVTAKAETRAAELVDALAAAGLSARRLSGTELEDACRHSIDPYGLDSHTPLDDGQDER